MKQPNDLESGARIVADGLTIEYPCVRAGVRNTGGARNHLALDGVSFALAPGERLGLLGRNGSGKSTLLKALAGVYPPVRGSLTVEGSVSAIFNASLGFEKQATGLENIYLRGAMLGLKFDDVRAIIPEIIEFSELGDWINAPIGTYSSGMALRLAFSITTSIRSDILLLDEWLGAGDAAFLKKARARMSDMVQDASILVLATHNLQLMRSQCNQALVLDDGRVKFFGDIDRAEIIYKDLRQLTQL